MKRDLSILLVGLMLFSLSTTKIKATEGDNTTEPEVTYVAQVGEEKFTSLKEACSSITSEGTIEVLEDISTTEYLLALQNGENITLKLNGHTVTRSNARSVGIFVYNGQLNIIGPGVINGCTEPNTYSWPIYVCPNYSDDNGSIKINIGEGVTINSYYCPISIYPNGTSAKNVTLNINGTINANGSMGYYAITTLGKITNTENPVTINLLEKASLSGIYGMYLAGYADTTIVEGAKVEGSQTGIEIRAGELTVNGGTVIGNGNPSGTEQSGSGSTGVGMGIQISQHTTLLPINVDIIDGYIKGYVPLNEYKNEKSTPESIEKIHLNVYDGTFVSTNETDPITVHSDNLKGFIQGGTYIADDSYLANDVEQYLVDGYQVVKGEGDSTFYVVKPDKPGDITVEETGDDSSAAEISNSKDNYSNLLDEEAKEAVDKGENLRFTLLVDKADITEDIKNNLKDNSVGIVLDIQLHVTSGRNKETRAITQTNGNVSITVDVPEELINTDETKQRTYQIIRVHDGVVDYLDGVFDKENNTFTFETDRFSTYALVYKDTNKKKDVTPATAEPTTKPESTNTNNNNNKKTSKTVNTADNSNVLAYALGLMLADIALIGVVYCRKKLS